MNLMNIINQRTEMKKERVIAYENAGKLLKGRHKVLNGYL